MNLTKEYNSNVADANAHECFGDLGEFYVLVLVQLQPVNVVLQSYAMIISILSINVYLYMRNPAYLIISCLVVYPSGALPV